MAPNMLVKDNGQYKLDDFDEEVALAIDTNKGLVIVSGCSHTGILNIVNSIQERSGKRSMRSSAVSIYWMLRKKNSKHHR